MKFAPLALLLTAGIFATSAHANCERGTKTLFSCSVQKSGKVVEVCDAGKTIQYSFGKPGAKPEMALAVPRSQASTFQWDGIGRTMPYSVNIPNGSGEYRVYYAVTKAPDEAVEGGINVFSKGKQIATVQCVPASITSHLEGLELKRADEW